MVAVQQLARWFSGQGCGTPRQKAKGARIDSQQGQEHF